MPKLVYAILGLMFAVMMLSPSQPDAPQSAIIVQNAPAVAALPAEPPKLAVAITPGETILQRAPDGHFYTDVQVNGVMAHFLVDTGASTIALSKADAQKIGMSIADGDFTGVGQGAGGKLAFKPVMLDRVTLGTMETTQVEAVVVDSDLPVSLLGQSWLKRVGSVSIEGDRMTLR